MTVGREGWPGAMLTLAWAAVGASLLAGYSAGGPLDGALALTVALPPATLAGVRAWHVRQEQGPPSGRARWLVRLALAIGVALLLAPLAWGLIEGPAPSWTSAWPAPVLRRFLPGPGEVWAYVVALASTAAASVPWRRTAIAAAGAVLAAGAVASGLALTWNAGAIAAGPDAGPAGCASVIGVPASGVIRSIASGELDGAALGSVEMERAGGGTFAVRHRTRWDDGSVALTGDDPATLIALTRTTLGEDERLTADDLGIDLVEGVPARHCQVVIDGRSAVRGFAALRWLTGGDERSADPGGGMEAWRGLLDYWVVPGPFVGGKSPGTRLVLASVSIDGQPPGWPFPGLHATLRATIWFEEP